MELEDRDISVPQDVTGEPSFREESAEGVDRREQQRGKRNRTRTFRTLSSQRGQIIGVIYSQKGRMGAGDTSDGGGRFIGYVSITS